MASPPLHHGLCRSAREEEEGRGWVRREHDAPVELEPGDERARWAEVERGKERRRASETRARQSARAEGTEREAGPLH